MRTQLQGDAAHIIGGFPLTDTNYIHSVELLKEKYGQQYKQVDAHMEALLNAPAPSHNLASLQSFHNTVQIHMRALSALDMPPESYGPLLTSVILSKLPSETRTNMARDHYDPKWTIDELLASISKEIRIFEAGQKSGRKLGYHTSSLPTTGSFHTATNHHRGVSHGKPRKDPNGIFCKGAHKPGLCNTVTCHDDTARINWKLAVIESVNKGADGLVRSANIRTATGRTNRPIACLYPLEVTATEMTVKPSTVKMPQSKDSDQPVPPSNRPVREAARRGQEQMKEWISYLRGPPEDVMDSD